MNMNTKGCPVCTKQVTNGADFAIKNNQNLKYFK
jgi:hypothetical protein